MTKYLSSKPKQNTIKAVSVPIKGLLEDVVEV